MINFIKKIYKSLSRNNCINNPKILIIPGFNREEEFVDQYYRLLWYLNPVLKNGGQVWIPTSLKQNNPLKPPEYMDPTILNFENLARSKFHFFNDDDLRQWRHAIRKTNLLICWNKNLTGGISNLGRFSTTILNMKRKWDVDRYSNPNEGACYLNISHFLNRNRKNHLKECQEKLSMALSEIGHPEKVYIFGTGPSLEDAFNRNFDDGICIACNSMVKNKRLMDHLKPKIIIFCDPIFHAGCSSYAMEFRSILSNTLEEYQSFFIVPFRDYALYKANLNKKFKDRIIGVPTNKLEGPNLDLQSSFEVMSTRNVITLMSIPFACTIAKEINILGCDGRKIEDNEYFWSHHKESQINEHMETIKTCHPAFFNIDYNDYYREHCDILDSMLTFGETLGCKFNNLTKSYIPSLSARSR